MRIIVLAFAVLLTAFGCGDDGATRGAADLSGSPQCPAGVAQVGAVKCDPAVDRICYCGPGCYMAHCQCNGYWETDLVGIVCDAGIGDFSTRD